MRIREGFPGQRLVVLPPTVQDRARRLPVVQDLHLTDLGHYPVAPHHYVHRPSGCPQIVLIYCTHGTGWCRIQGRKWGIDQASALLIPAGEPHAYGADAELPWSIYWVHFSGDQAGSLLRALGCTARQPILHAPSAGVISQAFEEVLSYVPHGYSDASLLGMSTSLSRLLGLLRWHQRAPLGRERHGEDKVLLTLQYMREHLDQPCHLPTLARLANASVSHYSYLFRRFTNASPVLYYTRLKLQQACQWLVTEDRTVAEISHALGYNDPLYFSRLFRRVIGTSPTQYRRCALEHSTTEHGR